MKRSAQKSFGSVVHATDSDIGHVEDFIVDDKAWCVSHLVVDMRNWLPGRRVLVSLQWIQSFSGVPT